MFLVVGQRTRTYGERRLPYAQVSVRPLVTPPIDFPTATPFPGTSITSGISTLFWPQVGGTDFVWTLETGDKDAQPGKLRTPLLWVNEAYNGPTKDPAVDGIYLADPRRVVDAFGQNIAFVPKTKDLPDARLETQRIYLRGAARLGGSDPTLTAAQVVLPAVQRLSPTDPLAIRYRDPVRQRRARRRRRRLGRGDRGPRRPDRGGRPDLEADGARFRRRRRRAAATRPAASWPRTCPSGRCRCTPARWATSPAPSRATWTPSSSSPGRSPSSSG